MEADEIKELESILIGLMKALGVSKKDAMISLALMRACHLQEDMILWVATFKGKEDFLTGEAFTAHLSALSDGVRRSGCITEEWYEVD